MRALQLFHLSEGSLLADYSSLMSEQLVRRRAAAEVREAREEMAAAEKAHAEFLANMNHELRTPLNAIMGFATMLRDGGEFELGDEKRGEYAEYILQSADLLLGHINTILEVAALESGDMELSADEYDAGLLLTEATARAKIRADAAGVEILRRGETDNIMAWGDRIRAGQAVDHVLQIAISACGEGGRVLIRTDRNDDGFPEIAIRDEGKGLSEAEIETVLGAFSERHLGLDRSFKNSGLGYAIAKTFVEMQGGQFLIKSRKSKGTLVRLVLPEFTGEEELSEDGDDENSVETTHAA